MPRSPKIQKVWIGRKSYRLISEAEYRRFKGEADGPYVDALEYASRSIGRTLRKKRLELKLTQSQVAEHAKVRLETVCRVERGDTNPTLKTIVRIAKALGIKT